MVVNKILILGPESTGKSTLASDLSDRFGEPWVPEFAREYLDRLGRNYVYEDLLKMGKGQVELEDKLTLIANKYLFCDTDLRVIHIWSQHKYGKTDPWILEEMERRSYKLILLTFFDLPWEADPLREHPEPRMREYFFNLYLKLAEESGFPFEVLSGSRSDRLQKAIQIIDQRF